MRILPLILAFALMTASCGRNNDPVVPNPQKPLGEDNQLIDGVTDPLKADGIQIKIAKNSLGHEFLFTAAQITGQPTPTGRAQASKVVYFERKASSIFLFESVKGKLSTDSVPTKILLTEFPITRENDNYITFDFKEGMNLLFVQSGYHASDSGDEVSTDVVKTVKSFIDKVELRGKYLFIDQYNRVEVPTAKGVKNHNLQVKYTLSSYVKNKKFFPKKTNSQKVVGYFEVAPTIEAGTGEKTVNIMKFDLQKPITYSMTKNIPVEYQQAVKDGILYWNRVFGKDLVKAEMLPAEISVHEPGYNIVQWLHWDTAGFAYANMQADPFTGENLQSHVYMTSVFGKGGVKKAKKQLKKYLANKAKQREDEFHLGLKGFQSAEICHYDGAEQFLAALNQLDFDSADLSKEEAEKIFMRFSQDYVRSVTAHEVGHTLGLRHNFAGSTTTTITPHLLPAVQKTYFLTGELLKGMTPGATVMDYTETLGSAMVGAHIRLNREALIYDKQAIDWGYSNKTIEEIDFVPFCTDTHRGKGIYHDCKVWDFLENPFQASHSSWKAAKANMPLDIVLKYSFLDTSDKEAQPEGGRVQDGAGRIKKLKGMILTPEADAKKLLRTGLLPIVEMLSNKAEFISIKREFPVVTSFNKKQYWDAIWKFQKESIEELGGITKVIFKDFQVNNENKVPLVLKLKSTMDSNFENLYSKIVTEEEMAIVKLQLDQYLPIFEKALLKEFADMMKDKIFNIMDEKLAETLTSMGRKVLFAKGEKVLTQIGEGEEAKDFFMPLFSKEVRTSVAQMTAHNFYNFNPSFNRAGKKTLSKLHAGELKEVLGEKTDDELSDELFNWKAQESKIFGVLK